MYNLGDFSTVHVVVNSGPGNAAERQCTECNQSMQNHADRGPQAFPKKSGPECVEISVLEPVPKQRNPQMGSICIERYNSGEYRPSDKMPRQAQHQGAGKARSIEPRRILRRTGYDTRELNFSGFSASFCISG